MGLKPKIIKPSDFINPLLSKKSVEQEKFEKFQNSLSELLKVNKTESEEHQKNAVRDFLVHSFGYEINTKGRIDWAIFKNAKVEVIIEAKRVDNLTEMLTKDELNRKAFHEAILYFMQERAEANVNLKHIIILTAFSWFIFDAKDFDRLFWQNKQIKKIYTNYKNPSILGDNTKDFYENIAKELPNLKANLIDDLEIECTYFNLQEPQKPKDLVAIYKLLSPDALLKEFNPNDANNLNREFYSELLYILGLEEIKQGSKKIIAKATTPQVGSFYENIANKLTQYGKSNDFETIIKLIIIWINRILFLKLLESQIVLWNKNREFKFLNASKINDYDKLEMLFFEILAKRPKERVHRDFDYIPYLNSSLFEIHAYEIKYLTVSNLEDDAKINYYSKTIIKDEKRAKKSGQTSTLAYLFEFLDAYDFGSTGDEIANESKSLINASVLGLIFEKINGYKDGSFYTPSFITMYMARESLQKSILEKFNIEYSKQFTIFNELIKFSNSFWDNQFVVKMNNIIDSLTICDPAVGSGHFLVSALNEIIYIKYQLGLFNLRGLKITLINDELLVKLEDEWFEYTKPKDFQSPNHTVQKMLFLEKQRIIENQLFGVDINPNSSQITKLRLWIELLKNSYYDSNYELITLPNIDINIKTGNSLISRFDLKDEIKINNVKHEIKNYKQRVRDYKENLGTKKDVLASIESLKNKFRLTLKAEFKVVKDRNQKLRQYVADFGHEGLNDDLLLTAIKNKYGHVQNLFGDKADTKKQAKLSQELTKLETQIDEIEKGKIYEDAFEWRFEFPEVLDEDGNFVGFDIVIGNPPYIMEDDNKSVFDGLREKPCYQGKTDIWHLFTCQGLQVLKPNGLISYIAKNQWLESQSASNMRESIYKNTAIKTIIDFGVNMVFEEASQQTMIFFLQKELKNLTHEIEYKKYISKLNINEIAILLTETKSNDNLEIFTKNIAKLYDSKANLTFSSTQNETILLKIEALKNFEFDEKKEMIQGIIGGPDEAFIVKCEDLETFNEDEKKYLKMLHTNTGKYYTKESEKYIFYISKKNFDNKNIEDFPNIKSKLEPFKNQLNNRRETLSGQKKWYHIWWERDESFFKKGDKIVFASRTEGAKFTFTNGSFYGSRNLFFIKSNRVNLKYITALLNSKSMYFYMHERLKHTGDLLQIDKNQFMKIPLFVADDKSVNEISIKVDEILTLKKQNPKADTSELESQIDSMVYNLYGLSDEEIKIVESKQKNKG